MLDGGRKVENRSRWRNQPSLGGNSFLNFCKEETGAGGGIYRAQGNAFDFFQGTRWRNLQGLRGDAFGIYREKQGKHFACLLAMSKEMG